ncbi:hypothetical protein HQ48_04595 [Porphyromonas sp. COT-290 OH3588]|nr:hypothetical protein HQ48_04595 [Porphyromonas sp. COT-290 OH3588]
MLLSLSVALASSWAIEAQTPTHPQYVKEMGGSEDFATLYRNWSLGSPLSKERVEDEEFFTSRVRPRRRFVESSTQVNSSLSTDRKFMWWVPCGVGGWNAVPSYFFNSEVFSTWSYIDHWGNWTAPYLRMPGAFADVAHKNGVSITATSSPTFGAQITRNNGAGLQYHTVVKGGVDKYLQYLKYYGLDGAGYNSEFRMDWRLAMEMSSFLANVGKKAAEQGFFNYSNDWYSLTASSGRFSSNWDDLASEDTAWFHKDGGVVSNHYFLNYNWYDTHLNTSKATAEGLGRSSYDVYAGINMQAGSGVRWELLSRHPISIGVWGAHRSNMLFENRGGGGSNPLSQQEEYQLASEYFFTGGKHNPISHFDYGRTIPSGSQAASSFFGISKLISARSTLHGNLGQEPFVTYFNLGNGRYFNLKGEQAFAGEWYNIGMQDFMPTWRWWFSTQFMGRTEATIPQESMKARFTWADAWFGGSCLEISVGSGKEQYLQLFKTKYELKAGDKLTVRYKVLRGTGSIAWANAAQGKADEYSATILDSEEKPQYGEWIEKTVEVGSGFTDLNMSDATLALIGLKFTDTSADFAVRLGEISLTRDSYKTPKAPQIVLHKVLDNNYKGHDFKLVYKMAEPKVDKTIIYNDEVNTWFYKIYAQQEGESEVFCTATTSWAAYVVGAKLNIEGKRRVRYGVSAVSLDGKTESPITWTDYVDLSEAKVVGTVSADRTTVNIGEPVRISFDDPTHPSAKSWTVKQDGKVIKQVSNSKSVEFSASAVGLCDVEYTLQNGQTEVLPAYISVVPEAAGTTPRINSITANGKNTAIEVRPDEAVTMAYTAKKSDGAVSRALRIQDKSFSIKRIYETLGIRLGNSRATNAEGGMTVSFWLRPHKTVYAPGEDGVRLVEIAEPHAPWPMSEWSYFWVNYGGGHTNNHKSRPSYQGFSWTNMFTGYDSNDAREKFVDTKPYKMEAGGWYHITVSLSYDLAAKIYINGVLLDETKPSDKRSSVYGSNYDLNISRYVKFASALDGLIDEVRVYDRVITEAEVKEAMKHSDNPQSIKGLKAYFDFEQEPQDGYFISRVGNNVKAEVRSLTWKGEGNVVWTKEPNPLFGPGTGLLPGNSYNVTTKAVWSAPKGKLADIKSSEAGGTALVSWSREGAYPVTLTLQNAWGEDTKTFNVVNVVKKNVAVEQTEMIDLTVYPNPFVEDVRIRFAEAGRYDIALYDLAGRQISRSEAHVDTAMLHTLHVDAPAGIYLLKISQAGRVVTTLKLQKK